MSQKNLKEIPTEVLDLDLPPEKRWIHIVQNYEYELKKIYNQLNNQELSYLGSFGKYGLLGLINLFVGLGKVKFIEELNSIAEVMEVPVSRVILMQLMYELSTCCTSSIINTRQDPILVRTMDWNLTSLDPLTINLNVKKGGRIIYQATTWVGYVGILTAVRPDHYAIAINYRRSYTNTIWDNFKACISMRWPIGYLVRDILDGQVDHHGAVELFKKSTLIAPCYITMISRRRKGPISGIVKMKDDGLVIQRNQYPHAEDDLNAVIYLGNNSVLTQTNIDQGCYDDDKDILWSIKRRDLAKVIGDGLLELGKGKLKVNTLEQRSKILGKYLTFPILNDETRYISLIHPGRFNTEEIDCLDSRKIFNNPYEVDPLLE